jgi:arylsulfatase A-like enzyme
LDRISLESVLYEQAITPAIWTLPSHVSIFTGLFPSKHGAHRAHQKFDAPYTTLAQLLTEQGYRSAAFFTPDWLDSTTNATRGFNEIYGKAFWQKERGKGSVAGAVGDKGGGQATAKAMRISLPSFCF